MAGMWDESAQKIKNMISQAKKRFGEKISNRKVAAQVMMLFL